MNKSQLKPLLLASLDAEIDAALAAAKTAREAAAHEDNQPENKYDTFSLEAAYLAHGQSERILGLQQERIQLARWQVPEFDDDSTVATGALITLVANGQKRLIWIALLGGRMLETDDGSKVQVISQQTPLAARLRGLGLEDVLVLDGVSWEIVGLQ